MAYWIKTYATGNEFQLILILKQYNNRVFRSAHKNGRSDICANVVHMNWCFIIKLC